MRTAILIAALLSMVTLAGCAESSEQVQDDELPEGVGEELQATETTGVIRGIVVDSAIVPVQGVDITLSTGQTAVTDEDGFFGFQGLEPGSYFIQAQKAGWENIQASTTVSAGEDKPPLVRIQMVPDPVTLPSVAALQFDGIIVCSFSLVAVGFAACSAAGLDDRFIVTYDMASLGGFPTYVQSEMIWQSTQALGENMNMLYSAPGDGALLHNYEESEGPSPLVNRANQTLLEENDVSGYGLQIRVFNSAVTGTDIGRDYGDPTDGDNCIERPALGGCANGLGATIDQRFVVYTHAFHNWEPAEDFQFSNDGAPEPPQ